MQSRSNTYSYLNDSHSASQCYARRFPCIGEGTYRPAYACVESKSEIQINAEPYKTYTFKNERGVPVVCNDGLLTVNARGDRDTTSIYAYDYDGQIVGKVNVMSYDKVTRKLCLVPIGDVKAPDAAKIKAELDKQFALLMVDFDVTIGEKIDIEYKDPSRGFIHGGSGLIGVYNKDQESAISKLKEKIKIDDETCYLFLVECSGKNQLDENDKQESKTVAGYMPRAYQFGFIYNQYDNIRAISHELCHGAFHLEHTFASGAEYIAPEGTTDNLMDYNGGETLNHWQWQDVHLPKSVRFKWAQGEAGAEMNLLPYIYWLGHGDFVGKFFSDELEDKVDDFLDIFIVGDDKRSDWSNGTDHSIDNTHKDWIVENNEIVPQIWLSIKNNEATEMSLKAKKVYSWAGNIVTSSKELHKFGSEEAARFRYVNLFSFVDNAKLSGYKINSLSDLKDNKRVKAGYYDYWSDKFFVIAFFSEEGSLDLVLQIPTIDSDVSLLAEDWVTSLLMFRNEPCDETETKDPIQYALEVISGYEGKTYHQDSGALRTGTDDAALAQMDCSELVCRFLQIACGLDNVPSMTTADFEILVDGSNTFLKYINNSGTDSHTDIQPGDIFLWRIEGGPGHVGVVKEYGNDVVTIIEAISSSGSREERKYNSGACKGCVRESKYTRTGKALVKHDGWEGYFRPIINTK